MPIQYDIIHFILLLLFSTLIYLPMYFYLALFNIFICNIVKHNINN